MGGRRPILDGAVVTNSGGEIVALLRAGEDPPGCDRTVHHQVLLPGFVNAHVHLTDSGIVEPISGGEGLVHWVDRLLSRRGSPNGADDRVVREDDIVGTLSAMRSYGTVAIGEVANDLTTLQHAARSGLRVRFVHEALGWDPSRANDIEQRLVEERDSVTWSNDIRHAFGLHAPYSVSRELALRLCQRTRESDGLVYIHLAEDPDERRLFVAGDGPWREFLYHRGIWDDAWLPPRVPPIASYDQAGILDHRFVAVHLADATGVEIALLARRGARAILSPRSNQHITGLVPDVPTMVRHGVVFAYGTDGRGSNDSVDVTGEARLIAGMYEDLPAGVHLESLTWRGAEILGFHDLGRLHVGCAPGLLSIQIPAVSGDYAELERSILFEQIDRHLTPPTSPPFP